MSRVAGPVPSTPPPPSPTLLSTPISPPPLNLLPPPTTSPLPISIFDWDDTLLPSTFLHSLGHRVEISCAFSENLTHTLSELSHVIIELLDRARRHGPVLIITNAETGWVQSSAHRFLPKVLAYLIESDVKIVSARSEFEREFPMPVLWKTAAFSREIARIYHQDLGAVNVVSVGDSWCERLAAKAFGECRGGCWVKTVKFVEMCKVEDVVRMVGLVCDAWKDLSGHQGSFDVNLRL